MLATTFTQLCECREVKLVPIWYLQTYILVSLVQEDILQAMETETWTPTQTQNPPPTIFPASSCAGVMEAQNVCELSMSLTS